jgi:hypothetical protein
LSEDNSVSNLSDESSDTLRSDVSPFPTSPPPSYEPDSSPPTWAGSQLQSMRLQDDNSALSREVRRTLSEYAFGLRD